jgi:hypothetical protein
MTPQIRFQKHQLADLQVIRDLDAESLRKAIAALSQLPPIPTRPAKIQKTWTEALGKSEKGGDSLLRQLLSLHGMVRQLDLSSDVLFKGLNASLQPPESEWTTEEYERWMSISSLVRELFELEVVCLSAKALDLSYEHSELLQRARILTDIRPVFNSDANEIRGTVITHSLMLRYDDIEGNHVITLSLDEKDIYALMRQCERALSKSKTAKDYLEGKTGLPAIVPGKDSDD